jgi:hypothetical protein
VQEPDHRLEDAQFRIAVGPQHLKYLTLSWSRFVGQVGSEVKVYSCC